MTRILGIDPSLTATGLALIDTEDRIVPDTWVITSKGKTSDTLAQRQSRLDRIAHGVTVLDADLAVIETPAHNQTTGHHHDRSGLWWLIVGGLLARDIPVVEVATTTVKKYATGKGNAPKDAVLLAVARRFPHVDIPDNNAADALVLAALGYDHLTGQPLVDLPQANRYALDAVAWPPTWKRAA